MLSNSRGPESLAAIVAELGSGAAAGPTKEAAEQDLVVLAVNWASVQAALFSVGDWTGRILVDATNRVAGYQPLALGDLSGRTSSEIIADLARGAKVVKAFSFEVSDTATMTVSRRQVNEIKEIGATIRRFDMGSADRTSNSNAFFPAITAWVFSEILLMTIHHIGNSRENSRVTSSWIPTGSTLTAVPP